MPNIISPSGVAEASVTFFANLHSRRPNLSIDTDVQQAPEVVTSGGNYSQRPTEERERRSPRPFSESVVQDDANSSFRS